MYIYAPGVVEGHGLKVFASVQRQFAKGKNYLMSNAIIFPSGYLNRPSSWAASINAEYAMPLFTGDLSLTSLLYIKRFSVIPFINYCRNVSYRGYENMYSVGSDLILDLNLLGMGFPLSLGARVGYTAENKAFFKLLFKTPL